MKNNKLRVIWIVPNLFCYIMFLGTLLFVLTHAEELRELNRLFIWVLTSFSLLLVSLFGSYRIWSWIKEGKM
ncbi:hypothetical protein ACAF76_013250 [Brevibacillus sp. TJ4]|uniref:hypothetical protein n=1 Tax=Brevibacillus sp. TJ4 TaxID=3234853 RepID=UPI0037CF329C